MSESDKRDASTNNSFKTANNSLANDGYTPREKSGSRAAKTKKRPKVITRGYSPGYSDEEPAVPPPPPTSGSNVTRPFNKN
ncbi:MAG: hypothetical protein LBO66_11660 [Deltaproteobacteria bacterium]|nr:hypothetical protein [Deltaproteobacteria bacterium]